MSASKDRLTAERTLPPVPSPSVVDTRIPQARRPSLSAAYAAPPVPPVTEEGKPGKITVEANLKPPIKLVGPIRLATPLSQLSRSIPPSREFSRAKQGPANVRSTPSAATTPVAKSIPRASPVAPPVARASTSGTTSTVASTAAVRVTTAKAPVSLRSTAPSPRPRAIPVSASRQSSMPTAANPNISITKPKSALPQARPPAQSAVKAVQSSVPRPVVKSEPRLNAQKVITPTSISSTVKRENNLIQQKVARPVVQANKRAVPGATLKRPAPVQTIDRPSTVRSVSTPNRSVVQPQHSARTSAAQVTNRVLTKPATQPGPQMTRPVVKVENKPAVHAPIQGRSSTLAISKGTNRPAVKPTNRSVSQVNRPVVKVENRVAATVTPHTPKPVARNLFQTPAASPRPAAPVVKRQTAQLTKPSPQVLKKPAVHTSNPATKAAGPARAPVTAAAATSVRHVTQNEVSLKPQRVVMKVVHPTPVVKTLTRPMARVIPSQALANVRSAPRTPAQVARANQARAQVAAVASGKLPVAGQILKTPVKAGAPGSAQTTPARQASASKPPVHSKSMSQLTAAQQKMLPSVPNMTPEILAAAVAAAAAVEPTPPLVGRGQYISPARSVSQTPKKPVASSASPQATPVRPAVPRVAPQPAPRPTPRPVTPAPAVTINVTPAPVPVPALQPATIPPGMTFRDGEHVTIWNKLELRKIAGNAAPLGKNLARYLREHPDCEVFVNQDEAVRASRRKRQKLNIEEAAAGEHIPIWNRVEKRKIAGNASPLAKNLKKYLETRPNCEVYTNQDVELKNRQQEERANRARSESLALEAAAQNRELYPDPFSESAPPLDDWIGMDPEAIMQALNHSSSRETASLLLGMCDGPDDDDINVAVMSGPGGNEDLDISEILEGPESVSMDDILLPGFPDDFLASPLLTNSPSVEIS